MWQQTLAQPLTFSGIGLHSGRPVKVTIYPAVANHGLRFVRADLPGQPEIQAHYSKVVDTLRATTLGEGRATLSTVEHLLAALLGAGVDNARIAVEGPEVPIMDGSAGPFAVLLAATGFKTLPWTYPDYASESMISFLSKVRDKYLLGLKAEKGKIHD